MKSRINELIDWEQLSDLSGGDTGFEEELLQIYLQDAVQGLERLEAAVAKAQTSDMRNIAHHIKGSSANVGAVYISKAAADIEIAAKNSQLEAVEAPLNTLRHQVNELRRRMESA